LRRQPSLRSQLNQIRLWVRQGRTDAWIAHKLDVSSEQLERFKRDHDLEIDGTSPGRPADPLSVPPPEADLFEEADEDEPEEVDEDETDEDQEEAPVSTLSEEHGEEDEPPRRDTQRRDSRRRPPAQQRDAGDETGAPRRSRRRGRRGGRGRRRPSSFEATFDHGEEEGYGLWLDPAVVDNPVYAQHWAGQRAVVVTFDRDAITIRRAGAAAEPADADADDGVDGADSADQ
jgi:hypothetical protein